MRRRAGQLAMLLALLAAAGCAAGRSSARAPESPSVLALPENDPVDHGTPRDRLLVTGTEQVTTAAAVDAASSPKVKVVRVLAPDLTVAQRDDVRRAFEPVPWAPPPEGAEILARMATVRPETPPAR